MAAPSDGDKFSQRPPPSAKTAVPLTGAPAKTASASLTSFDTVSSAREPETWQLPRTAKVINTDHWRQEDKTQSPEAAVAPVPPEPPAAPGIGEVPVVATEETRIFPETVLDQEQFDKKYGFCRNNLSLIRVFENRVLRLGKWRRREWCDFVKNRVPSIEWLLSYDWRHDLVTDIIGGLMVSIMSIPQGLAYGFLVGLPPIHGLYSSIFGPIIYALLGTSRHTSPGAFAIISLMVGTVVEQMTSSNDGEVEPDQSDTICCAIASKDASPVDEVIEIVSGLTLLVGLIQIVLGILNAGLLAVWLSDHLVQGLTSGAAIHVLTSQVKYMTGVKEVPPTSDPNGIIKFYICFFDNIESVKLAPCICSAVCVFLLLYSKLFLEKVLIRFIKIKFPMELAVVVFSILLTQSAHGTDYDLQLEVVGHINGGAYFAVPSVRYLPRLVGSAFTIAIISFVIHIALAKLLAKKLDYTINANQEWLALGAMHSVSSFFGCFAGGSSLSRTMTQERLGTKTQLSTLVCASVVASVVAGLAFCFKFLPKPVLSCIVVVALKDLFVQIWDAQKLFKQSIIDFLIWLVTFMAVVLINVNIGLVVGVAFALLTVVFRSQWPESSLLGRIPGTRDFKGLTHYRASEEVPGIFVYRFDAPLYFANAELFLNRIRAWVDFFAGALEKKTGRVNFRQMGLQPVLMSAAVKKRTKKVASARERQSRRELASGKTAAPKEPLLGETNSAIQKDEIEVVFKNNKVQNNSPKPNVPPPQLEEASAGAENQVHVTHIIIDCSSFPYIDLMGLDALGQIHQEFAALAITVYFAYCKLSVRQLFERTEFYKRVPKKNFFVSVWDAVNQAQKDRSSLYAIEEKTTNVELPVSLKSTVQGVSPAADKTDPKASATTNAPELKQRKTTSSDGIKK